MLCKFFFALQRITLMNMLICADEYGHVLEAEDSLVRLVESPSTQEQVIPPAVDTSLQCQLMLCLTCRPNMSSSHLCGYYYTASNTHSVSVSQLVQNEHADKSNVTDVGAECNKSSSLNESRSDDQSVDSRQLANTSSSSGASDSVFETVPELISDAGSMSQSASAADSPAMSSSVQGIIIVLVLFFRYHLWHCG